MCIGVSNGDMGGGTKQMKYDREGFLRRLFEIMMKDAVEAGCNVNKYVIQAFISFNFVRL